MESTMCVDVENADACRGERGGPTARLGSLVLAALFAVLYFAASIGKLLSSKMRVIMARVMGMILSAIALFFAALGPVAAAAALRGASD